MSLRDWMLIALGGSLGAVARHAVGLLCSELFGARFPWGTFAANVLGCFLLGWLLHGATSDAVRLCVGTGFLGAFTTFSTFGVQSAKLWNDSPVAAMLNIAGNVVIGLVAAVVGIWLASRMANATG